MPTVKYSCPDSGKMKTKSFPYNAVGKARSMSKAERAKTARKKKRAGRRGQTVVANTQAGKVTKQYTR